MRAADASVWFAVNRPVGQATVDDRAVSCEECCEIYTHAEYFGTGGDELCDGCDAVVWKVAAKHGQLWNGGSSVWCSY